MLVSGFDPKFVLVKYSQFLFWFPPRGAVHQQLKPKLTEDDDDNARIPSSFARLKTWFRFHNHSFPSLRRGILVPACNSASPISRNEVS